MNQCPASGLHKYCYQVFQTKQIHKVYDNLPTSNPKYLKEKGSLTFLLTEGSPTKYTHDSRTMRNLHKDPVASSKYPEKARNKRAPRRRCVTSDELRPPRCAAAVAIACTLSLLQ